MRARSLNVPIPSSSSAKPAKSSSRASDAKSAKPSSSGMISNSSPVCSEPQPSAGLNSPPRQTGLMDLLQKTREQKRRLLLASTAAQDAGFLATTAGGAPFVMSRPWVLPDLPLVFKSLHETVDEIVTEPFLRNWIDTMCIFCGFSAKGAMTAHMLYILERFFEESACYAVPIGGTCKMGAAAEKKPSALAAASQPLNAAGFLVGGRGAFLAASAAACALLFDLAIASTPESMRHTPRLPASMGHSSE